MVELPDPESFERCTVGPYIGSAYRGHARIYLPTDFTGSSMYAGRLHELPSAQIGTGQDRRTGYLAIEEVTALGEIIRHQEAFTDMSDAAAMKAAAERNVVYLSTRRLTRLELSFSKIRDARNLDALGISRDAFFVDGVWDAGGYISQALGQACRLSGDEGVMVPSATRLGDSLILFLENKLASSQIHQGPSRDPSLFLTRP